MEIRCIAVARAHPRLWKILDGNTPNISGMILMDAQGNFAFPNFLGWFYVTFTKMPFYGIKCRLVSLGTFLPDVATDPRTSLEES